MTKVSVCNGRNCTRHGSPERLFEALQKSGINEVEYRGCTGYCEMGPNVVAEGKIYHQSKSRDIAERIQKGDGIVMKKITIEDLKLDDDLL